MTKTVLMNNRFALVWLAFGLLAGLVIATTFGGSTSVGASDHTGVESVVVSPTEVDLEPGKSRSGSEVWIRGGGFTPGTEVLVLVEDGNGVLYDFTNPASSRRDGGGSVSPLVANDAGGWATNWRLGRFTRNNVGAEGMQTIWVVDMNWNNLATAPIAFCNHSGRAKALAAALEADPAAEVEIEVPTWCSK